MSSYLNNDWTNEAWVNWSLRSTNYSNGSYGIGCNRMANDKDFAPVATADIQVSLNPNRGSFNVAQKGLATSTVTVKIAALNSGKVYYTGKAKPGIIVL